MYIVLKFFPDDQPILVGNYGSPGFFWDYDDAVKYCLEADIPDFCVYRHYDANGPVIDQFPPDSASLIRADLALAKDDPHYHSQLAMRRRQYESDEIIAVFNNIIKDVLKTATPVQIGRVIGDTIEAVYDDETMRKIRLISTERDRYIYNNYADVVG